MLAAHLLAVLLFPALVLAHHMPGWDEATKEITRKFAHHGYVAISPNLHFREGKGDPYENSASVRAAVSFTTTTFGAPIRSALVK